MPKKSTSIIPDRYTVIEYHTGVLPMCLAEPAGGVCVCHDGIHSRASVSNSPVFNARALCRSKQNNLGMIPLPTCIWNKSR